ncbi:MAG: NAD(P)H-dependent oxidoreductase [Corynebacterium sp.]|uniref:NADPH-dependent FMN reductase n=1 Tax=Corynebacterium sp. TaxID=1720 RepID=UPI0026DB2A07|nr:NAD(P)H-dependent oxidoreductase [Corynebacterium sp.]MDO5030655.1 NAD(P)H-dependent oxidoreductase [Corynebacterium sp.]
MSSTQLDDQQDKIRLGLIVGTTRPGRLSAPISQWLLTHLENDGRFDVTVLDLAEINLPLFDEPHHPRLQRYEHDHTKAWSQQVAAQDAFIFMTAEYNHSIPASLKNAIDYLSVEWGNKPASIVSYGGISAGIRAAEHLQSVLGALGMKITPNAVTIPFHFQRIDEAGFHATDIENQSATNALNDLAEWDRTLRPLRG